MSGLILISIIVLWVIAIKKLTIFLTQSMPASGFTRLAKVLLFALLLVLPFADEIIGGFQFRALCKAEAVAIYDKEKVYGKTVHLKSAEVIRFTKTILPMHKQIWKYADHATNDELISYVDLKSEGGWLRRWVNFNNVRSPMFFDGNCSGDKDSYLFQNLNIKDSDRN